MIVLIADNIYDAENFLQKDQMWLKA